MNDMFEFIFRNTAHNGYTYTFIPPVVDPAQAPNNMMMHINVQSTGTQVI